MTLIKSLQKSRRFKKEKLPDFAQVFLRTLGQFYSPCGEWYCYAVIFELRSSDIAFGSLWRIKYHWNRMVSISLPEREISLCAKSTEYHYIKITTRKRVLFSLLWVVLSYTVTSRKFVCQISFLLKITVLSNPAHITKWICFFRAL